MKAMSRHKGKIIACSFTILFLATYFACIGPTLPVRFVTASADSDTSGPSGVLLLTESITRTQERDTFRIQFSVVNNSGHPIYFVAHSPGIGELSPMYAMQVAERFDGVLERKSIHCGHGWSPYVMLPGFATRFRVRLTDHDREARYGFTYQPSLGGDYQTTWSAPFRYKDHRTTP